MTDKASMILFYTQAIRLLRSWSGWSLIEKKDVFKGAYSLN